jgi:hypothetical protein
MYVLRRPFYNNLLKNNNTKRFFSLNITNNLTVIDNKLDVINYNIKSVYYIAVTNLFVSVVSLFC